MEAMEDIDMVHGRSVWVQRRKKMTLEFKRGPHRSNFPTLEFKFSVRSVQKRFTGEILGYIFTASLHWRINSPRLFCWERRVFVV